MRKIFIIALLVAVIIGFIYEKYQQELRQCLSYKGVYSGEVDEAPLEHLNALDKLDHKVLALGVEEMKKHKIVICGITRDNALDSAVVFKHIEHIGGYFADYRVIIFENDSTDGTKAALQQWQNSNKKVKIESVDYSINKRPSIKFLADARNHYLDILEGTHEYDDFDMVMVIDMDMSYGVDIRGVMNSFSTINNWDAVCANGIQSVKGRMYDMFSFYNDEFSRRPRDGESKYWGETVIKGQKHYPIDLGMIPVKSCFGGLAFYKRKVIDTCRYDSPDGDCEHIHFHECLHKKGGKMFMNTAMIIKYSHFKYKPIWSRGVDYLLSFNKAKSKGVCY